jgi:hypothetical protein
MLYLFAGVAAGVVFSVGMMVGALLSAGPRKDED